jgi:uncharacterized membrane protein YcaP (DUF421 family)
MNIQALQPVARQPKHPSGATAVRVSELVFRGFVVYTFLLVLLRLPGSDRSDSLAAFDLVLLLLLSNAFQNQ